MPESRGSVRSLQQAAWFSLVQQWTVMPMRSKLDEARCCALSMHPPWPCLQSILTRVSLFVLCCSRKLYPLSKRSAIGLQPLLYLIKGLTILSSKIERPDEVDAQSTSGQVKRKSAVREVGQTRLFPNDPTTYLRNHSLGSSSHRAVF